MEEDFGETKRFRSTAAQKEYAEEEKQAEGHIYFPHDIIVEILLRLPVKALAKFRIVCKLWNSLIHEPSFIDTHYRERLAHNSIVFATLSMRDKVPTLSKLDFNGKLIGEFSIPDVPIHDYRLSNMVNGLVCLYGRRTSYLLNPETRESIMLPTSNNVEFSKYATIMNLGFTTKTSEYKLFRIYYDKPHCRLWEILTFGSNEWRSIRHSTRQVDEVIQFKWLKLRPVFLHGALYWIVVNESIDGILSFDLADEKFGFLPAPASPLQALDIMELDEHLGFVRVCMEKKLMEIWKLKDHRNAVWTREYSISLLAMEVEPGFGDCIRVSKNGNVLFWSNRNRQGVTCYDTRTKTFTRPISEQNLGYLQLLIYTESLVSPKNLIS